MPSGGCHCGDVRYVLDGDMHHHAVCHCADCRRSSGALMVPWVAFDMAALTLERGTPAIYRSSEHGERHFCPKCGTGLFYYNEQMLPGIVDVQSVTFDEAEAWPPQAHIQTADSLPWEETLDGLPRFERYPGQ
ncbi:GFA family protein [Tsuneonella sp. HG249]